jgi:predicted DsbA family dithiol-disulfide isomerase
LIVMSTEDGKVLADLPIGAGVDATKFHQATHSLAAAMEL